MQKMRWLIAILVCVIKIGYGADFPTNSTSANIDIADLKSDFRDFSFNWVGWSDQIVDFVWTNDGSALNIESFYATFKANIGTTCYILVEDANITKSGNVSSFSIAHTNIPPDGTYKAEMLLYTAADPPITRSVARGKLGIKQSIYATDDSAFPFPEIDIARTTFLGLTDTPSNYSENIGKGLIVNPAGTALIYTDTAGGDITAVTVSGGLLSGGGVAGSVDVALTTTTVETALSGHFALQSEYINTTGDVAQLQSAQESISNDVDVLKGSTSLWDQGAADGTAYTSSVAATITSGLTGEWSTAYGWGDHSTNDYSTGTPVYVEIDPVWTNASTGIYTKVETDAKYATGTPIYVEIDPVWTNASTGYYNKVESDAEFATGVPVYVESDPVFTASVAKTITSGLTDNWTTAYGWGDHATNDYALSNAVVHTNSSTWTSTVVKAATAYGWGNHADVGYLTGETSLFTSVTIADRSQTTTNLCSLTDGTYTGVLTSVAFTGTCATVRGRTYIWGFTKQNAFGTSTLSASTFTLTATEAGALSNYFTPLTVITQVVLTLDGDGSSKSDVSAVYLKQITNGNLYVAEDAYIGSDLYLGKTNSIRFPDVDLTSAKINLYDTFDAEKAGTASVATVATDLNLASNALHTAITTETERAESAEEANAGYTNRAALGYIAAIDATARVEVLESSTQLWNTGASDATSATGNIAILFGSTSLWNQGAADGTVATQYIGTNTVQAQLDVLSTQKYDKAEALATNATFYPRANPSNFATVAESAIEWSGYPATQMVGWVADVDPTQMNAIGWAGSAVNGTNIPGGTNWTNPNSAITNDGSAATVLTLGDETHDLVLTNFGFNIPSGTIIEGIVAHIVQQGEGQEHTTTYRFSLYKDGNAVDPAYTNTIYHFTTNNFQVWCTNTIGTTSSLWQTTLTPDDVNDTGFGVGMSATNAAVGDNYVDAIWLTAYYKTTQTNWSMGATTNDEFEFQYAADTVWKITSSGATGAWEGVHAGDLTIYTNRAASALDSSTWESADSTTNIFTGVGTTGRVTSVIGNTNSYLKGDGTWGTPEGAGDFKADGTVEMAGDLNMGTHSITNIGTNSLEFSDGVGITSTKIQLYDTLNTNLSIVSNALHLAITTEVARAQAAENAVGLGATNLALAIGLGGSNYADTVGNAIGLGATNFALAIGAGATNYTDTIGNAVGLGATNYVDTVGNAIGLGATNYADTVGNAVGLGATNYANTVGNAVGLGGTNLSLAIGAGATNLALAIGAGGSNYADTVGNAVGLGATNLALAIGTGATNLGNAIGLGATNYADTVGNAVGLGATNLATVVSNAIATQITAAGAGYSNSFLTIALTNVVEQSSSSNYIVKVGNQIEGCVTNTGAAGGITLTGNELIIDSSDWFGWETGEGSTTNNAIVAVGYSTPDATNNINSGWAWYSSQGVLQDKYSYARLRIPSYATSWNTVAGATAVVVRVRTSGTGILTNKVNLLFTDSTGTNTYATNSLVSSTANAWREYPILLQELPAAWSNALPRPYMTIRADSFSMLSNYCGFVEMLCDWD